METSPKTRAMTALAALTAVLSAATAAAAPGDILFSDNFEDGTLAAWTTSNASVSGVSNNPGYAGGGAWGAYTSNQAVIVTSPSFGASVPDARLDIWVRRGADSFSEDTDNNENFVLEYRRADNSWGALRTWLGSGTKGQVYQESFLLPADALHGSLAIRLRQTQGSGFDYDYWHFDDIVVTELAPAQPLAVGTCDDFENGLNANWTVNRSTGFAGVSAATAASPQNSMYLNGGIVDVQSNIVDTGNINFTDMTMWIRRGDDFFSEDPDGGENLLVEYLNDVGTWTLLETFPGAGGSGQIFNRSYTLPADGRHAGFRLRFRMTAGSGAAWDYWHIDDVCFDQQPVPDLVVTKTAQTISDPINGTSNPLPIPGAVVLYTITVVNQGSGAADADSLVITDPLPANTAMYVDDTSGDPVVFIDGAVASGLSYSYVTDVSYSNQPGGGPPFNYSPNPAISQGFDPNVTGFRFAPSGPMNAASGGNNPSFVVRFRVRVE